LTFFLTQTSYPQIIRRCWNALTIHMWSLGCGGRSPDFPLDIGGIGGILGSTLKLP
jgi:hypothetical protein